MSDKTSVPGKLTWRKVDKPIISGPWEYNIKQGAWVKFLMPKGHFLWLHNLSIDLGFQLPEWSMFYDTHWLELKDKEGE